MKKIKLLMPILSVGIIASTMAPLASCSCSQTAPVTLDQSLIDKGFSVKSTKLGYLKDSFIELNTPNNKSIENVEVKVGDITLTKGDHLRVDGSIIWIEADYMVSTNVTIKSVKLVKEVTSIEPTCSKDKWEEDDVIKASDLSVILTYDDGSKSSPLTWGTDYSISKGDIEISDFITTGYKFTTEDADAKTVSFKVTYITKPEINKTFSVNVSRSLTIDEWFDLYTPIFNKFVEATKSGTYNKCDVAKGDYFYDGDGNKIVIEDASKSSCDLDVKEQYPAFWYFFNYTIKYNNEANEEKTFPASYLMFYEPNQMKSTFKSTKEIATVFKLYKNDLGGIGYKWSYQITDAALGTTSYIDEEVCFSSDGYITKMYGKSESGQQRQRDYESSFNFSNYRNEL